MGKTTYMRTTLRNTITDLEPLTVLGDATILTLDNGHSKSQRVFYAELNQEYKGKLISLSVEEVKKGFFTSDVEQTIYINGKISARVTTPKKRAKRLEKALINLQLADIAQIT